MKVFCGIDPGAVSGAFGFVDLHGRYLGCGDIPNKDGKIDSRLFKNLLSAVVAGQDVEFCIESVHAFSGQGVSSTFKFGRAVGVIDAVCEAFVSPVHYISPQKWKKYFGLTQDKNLSLELARKMWPDAPLTRKKDNGRAESLLLAEFFRRTMYE